jgi:trehalose 6-phosphate synthase
MADAVNGMAGRINGAYSNAAWSPMRYVNRAYSRTALAGLYRSARAALVTPLRDGMNLVAKEYVAAQDAADPGVLILSRFTGAAVEFKEGALLVNPYDPDSVAAAIARALAMPLPERKNRHGTLYATLLDNDISKWGDRFLAALMGTKSFDLKAVQKPSQPSPAPLAH